MESFDFSFEMETAELLGETDRRDLALMERFDGLRPLDLSRFGGWADDALEMLDLLDFPTPSCIEGRECEQECWWTQAEQA